MEKLLNQISYYLLMIKGAKTLHGRSLLSQKVMGPLIVKVDSTKEKKVGSNASWMRLQNGLMLKCWLIMTIIVLLGCLSLIIRLVEIKLKLYYGIYNNFLGYLGDQYQNWKITYWSLKPASSSKKSYRAGFKIGFFVLK